MFKEKQRVQPSRNLPSILWMLLALSLLTVNCAPQLTLARGAALTLATYSENSVEVVIKLQRAANGDISLTALYTPLEAGFHLYGKDLPRNGIAGVGRPTLLELGQNAKIQTSGALTEDIASKWMSAYPNNLLIYPEGPVTLTLPVRLPAGRGWVEDQISLTYMACSASTCKKPVIGKVISIKVPSAEALTN